MRADPRCQILAARRLGVDQPAGAEHADEEFDENHVPRRRVDQGRPFPGEIDEELLAGAMHLAHRRLQHPRPLAIAFAEVAVGVPGRVRRTVLGPEQLQRHADPLQFLVQVGPFGDRPVEAGRIGRARKQAHLQRRIIQAVGQRPGQPGRRGAGQHGRHRAQPHRARLGNGAVRQAGFVFQA